MTETPEAISARLLSQLLVTLKEMSPTSEVAIDQSVLLLGMADALGGLLTSISPEAQAALIPAILERIVGNSDAGQLIVVRSEPTEH